MSVRLRKQVRAARASGSASLAASFAVLRAEKLHVWLATRALCERLVFFVVVRAQQQTAAAFAVRRYREIAGPTAGLFKCITTELLCLSALFAVVADAIDNYSISCNHF